METTLSEKFIAYLTLLSGLALSAVAVYYSVSGLTAIFAAAVIPIIIMGVTLEVSKIVATVWLKQNWNIAPLSVKAYLCSAIALLMVITSMGIFGFLSKAHSDQNLVSGDVLAKVAVYDEKIKTEKENIDANRKALKQMDEAVDQVMGRSQDEKGAEKAVAIRRTQQKERGRLSQDITESQKRIAELSEERAPIAAEVRKVEAEVGPIKYIAAFVYGNTDPTILERAVTWVIITIIVVFDPMALILLLASQISFQQFKKRKETGGVLRDSDGTIVGIVPPTIQDLDTFVGEKPTKEELAEIENETEGDSPLGTESVVDVQDPTVTEPTEQALVIVEPKNTSTVIYHFVDESDGDIESYASTTASTSTSKVIPTVKEPDNRSILQKLYDAEFTKHSIERGYVQNEEQAESNVWSTVNNISKNDYIQESQIRLENHINEIVDLIHSGEITIEDVPQYIQKEVKEKL
jgi:hypothetical protein